MGHIWLPRWTHSTRARRESQISISSSKRRFHVSRGTLEGEILIRRQFDVLTLCEREFCCLTLSGRACGRNKKLANSGKTV